MTDKLIPPDAINRCWLKIDSLVHQEPDIEGPMSHDDAIARMTVIRNASDAASVTVELIDADDSTLTIPGSVARGNFMAPYYSTLRELLTAARNVASQGASVFRDDDELAGDMNNIATQIERVLDPIR